jgi:outer membrane lipoprotein-sorting protein
MLKPIFFVFVIGIMLLSACQPTPTVDEELPAAGDPASLETASPTEVMPTEATVELATPEEADTGAPIEAPSNNRPTGDAVDEIISALLALGDQSSFRMDSTITYSDSVETFQFEVVPPDRMRLIDDDFEMILVEDALYIYDDGEWFQMPGNMGLYRGMMMILLEEQAEEFRSSMTGARFLGEEMLDGENTRVYEFEGTDENFEAAGVIKLWVGADDGLLRRIETMETDPEDGDSGQVVNIYRDYNTPITIEPPVQ